MYLIQTNGWYLERVTWLIAGVFSLGSALLAWLHSPWWLLLTGLVGVNLIIFAVTGFCLMANILYAAGFAPRLACPMAPKTSTPDAAR
jgi:hypothetical protein